MLNKVPRSAALAENSHPPATRPEDGEGAYLVGAICRECHELDQTHNDGWGMVTPPLRAMAKAYSPEDFRRLLRTGEATGGRNAGLMSAIAKIDLSHLTNGEIDAIHNYLRSGT